MNLLVLSSIYNSIFTFVQRVFKSLTESRGMGWGPELQSGFAQSVWTRRTAGKGKKGLWLPRGRKSLGEGLPTLSHDTPDTSLKHRRGRGEAGIRMLDPGNQKEQK